LLFNKTLLGVIKVNEGRKLVVTNATSISDFKLDEHPHLYRI